MPERGPPPPRRRPRKTLIIGDTSNAISSPITPDPTPPTLETTLNTRQTHAFTSLAQIIHLPPSFATVFSSLYRTFLGTHTFVSTFAQRNGYDVVWL
ncbi:MAG: hypothetical protein Q9226_007554, partial [Calogaya cf. arnoldii]